MTKLEMTVYSVNEVSCKEQLAFTHNLFTYENYGKGPKLGIFEKFANSIGFKDVEWHYGEDAAYIEAKVDSPKGYHSPYHILITSMCFLNKRNEYISFIVEENEEKHTDDKYTYNTINVLFRFQQFLYKVYGNLIRIEFKFRKDEHLELKDWLLSHFYIVVAQGEHYDTECAVTRLLTKREKRYILKEMKKYVSYEPDIKQFYCDTCAGYHEDRPYHTELVDKVKEKEWEEEDIRNGLYLKYLDL